METLYELIRNNPELFTNGFIIINALWIVFIYFNKQRHEEKLKSIQHDLNLDLERRKKVFELKVKQYENYVKMLDEFGKEYQTELFSKMQPTFENFLKKVLNAKNEEEKKSALNEFSLNIMSLMDGCMRNYYLLKSESRSLKLTASDSLILIFEELESLVDNSIEEAKKLVNELPMLIISNNHEEIERKQVVLNTQSDEIQLKSKSLEFQMRSELSKI